MGVGSSPPATATRGLTQLLVSTLMSTTYKHDPINVGSGHRLHMFGMRTHQHHPARSTRIDAITIVIGHDQAGGAGPNRLLDKSVEGAAQFHQAGAFFLEHLPDRTFLELGMLGALNVALVSVLRLVCCM